ncbi:MAG: hypothetical protein HY696_00495 [Deltaproteobacteria bacterium]|nr:hypothetical protein [Deltaproteobacteria bacterium]
MRRWWFRLLVGILVCCAGCGGSAPNIETLTPIPIELPSATTPTPTQFDLATLDVVTLQ